MAEAAVFISLSASVGESLQAMALSGLFLAASVGAIGGLAACSAVLETSLEGELQRRLADRPDRDSVFLLVQTKEDIINHATDHPKCTKRYLICPPAEGGVA